MAERKRAGLWALIGLVGALLMVFAVVVGPWLLTRFPQEGITAQQELEAKNDVRTTLVQALAGLAVAGGLVVTYRTYRHNRIEQDRTYERELYAKAIEQLGHDHAPVRLGALYSLATLGQDRPDRRQMVVDVLCAYLRTPYVPPPESADAHSDQERQVRLTAERLVSEHVRRPDGVSGEDAQRLAPSPDQSFWPGISLDLTGAFLISLDLSQASVVDARFDGATFSTGRARFTGATFTGDAWFDGAKFTGEASFDGATFTCRASFVGATFTGIVSFGATFADDSRFDGATFTDNALFEGATFTGSASFEWVTFTGWARFLGTTFTGGAWFVGARFTGATMFGGASFTGRAELEQVTFTGDAEFEGATFSRPAQFDRAQVLNLDDLVLEEYRVWPNGWTVRANADDPTRGTLVREPPGP